jgi:hypothetical protein
VPYGECSVVVRGAKLLYGNFWGGAELEVGAARGFTALADARTVGRIGGAMIGTTLFVEHDF